MRTVPISRSLPAALLALAALALPPAAEAQRIIPAAQPPAESTPPYADVADLVAKSPVIADAVIRSAAKLKGPDSAGVAPGRQRLLVTADVVSLLRGPAALPPQINYLLDVTPDEKGRTPKLKKLRVLLFARGVASYANQLQLTGDTSQQPWTPAIEALTRRIAKDMIDPAAPPIVTGIGNAFHVPGALPGEGETQIFLTTADSRPVSLSVLSRPGEQRRWAVALSEIVDESAAPPAPDTLLWYRLACFLPRTLPDRSLNSDDAGNAALARGDYQFVLDALGPCTRTPGAKGQQ